MERLQIALVDDDEDDLALLKECFEELTPASIHGSRNGQQFIESKAVDGYPCMIVIDLNLPGISGINLVQTIRKDSSFSEITVIVFTTGGTPLEKQICEHLNIPKYRKQNSINERTVLAKKMIKN